MLRLLVLGNGFDIAHGYSTKYIHFLSFCSEIAKISDSNVLVPEGGVKKIIDSFNANYDIEDRRKIIDLIRNNGWIEHFINKVTKLGETWIDFEREIQECCIKSHNNDSEDAVDEFMDWGTCIHDLEKMKSDFKKLIFLLKVYIKIATHFASDVYYQEILDFAPNVVINFNYSKTLENYATSKLAINYIHGIADSDDVNNIVLGFNTMDDKKTDIEYAEFLKYFQMVENENKTDVFNNYISEPTMDKTVMFFGHSLDSTDEDIIKNVISNSSHVYILWHDKNAKNRCIKNLIDIFGKEEFMSMCFASHGKIEFVKQGDPIEIDDNFKLYKELTAIDGKSKLLKLLKTDNPSISFRLLHQCSELAIKHGPSLGFSNENIATILNKLAVCLSKIKSNSLVDKFEIDETSQSIKRHLYNLNKYVHI